MRTHSHRSTQNHQSPFPRLIKIIMSPHSACILQALSPILFHPKAPALCTHIKHQKPHRARILQAHPPKTPTLPSTLHSTLLQGEYQTSKHQNTQNGREGARMHTGAKSLSPRPSQLNFLRSKSSFHPAPALCQHIKHQKLTAPALCKHIPQNLHSKSSGNLSLKPHPRGATQSKQSTERRSAAIFAHGTFVI